MPYQILLVEDDREFREELICSLEDYHVLEASTAREAVEILKKPHMIDLVILDFSLPDKEGTDILKEIKHINPQMGVVMLTGYGSKDVAVAALRGHADDYIEKPPDIAHLHETIKRLIKRKEHIANGGGTSLKDKIQFVQRFIERNYDKKVSLKNAADQIFLSPKYFSRVFKEDAGIGFNEYKLQLRMEKAKELLKNTNSSIHELAERFGYQNLESFIRIFKKYSKYTPQRWLEKYTAKNRTARPRAA